MQMYIISRYLEDHCCATLHAKRNIMSSLLLDTEFHSTFQLNLFVDMYTSILIISKLGSAPMLVTQIKGSHWNHHTQNWNRVIFYCVQLVPKWYLFYLRW